jgi:hypothetical protein
VQDAQGNVCIDILRGRGIVKTYPLRTIPNVQANGIIAARYARVKANGIVVVLRELNVLLSQSHTR